MLSINQCMLDWIFRNLETSNYLLWPDNHFGWALPHKHFCAVSNTSINLFYYADSMVLQNYCCCNLSLQVFFRYTTHNMYNGFYAGKQASSAKIPSWTEWCFFSKTFSCSKVVPFFLLVRDIMYRKVYFNLILVRLSQFKQTSLMWTPV